MPVNFLTPEQAAQYGRYTGEPSSAQRAQYFFLDDADRDFLRPLRQDETRWGCAVQLGTIRFLGTFVEDPTNVPASILTYVAEQLDLTAPMNIGRYWRGRMHWHHQDAIIRQYRYHVFDAEPGHWRFVRWLYTSAWTAAERPSVLFDQATAYLLDQKILLPGVSTLSRLVAQIRDRTQARLWQRLAAMPDAAQRDQLPREDVSMGAHNRSGRALVFAVAHRLPLRNPCGGPLPCPCAGSRWSCDPTPGWDGMGMKPWVRAPGP